MPATQASGASFLFDSRLTLNGGQYRLCWCAGEMRAAHDLSRGYLCSVAEDFKVDVGELVIVGPDELGTQLRTCVAGQTCVIDNVRGVNLHEKDALMVLDTCGQHTIQDRVDLNVTPPVLQTSVATLFQDPVFNLEAPTLNWPDAARAVSGQPGATVANGTIVLRVPDALRSFSSVRADNASGAGYNQSTLNSPLAWSPATNGAAEWVQLDLGREYVVRALVTQGRQTIDEWVTTYRALVSRNGTNFTAVGDFAGNDDRATWRTRRITEVTARYVRVVPLTWHNAIAMRVDVDVYQTVEAMRTYSSVYMTALSMLGSEQAWSAGNAVVGEWAQLDLGTEKVVTAVITQGREEGGVDQRVTTFRLEYSLDGVDFIPVGSRSFGPRRDVYSSAGTTSGSD
jgi:hypothetical protein